MRTFNIYDTTISFWQNEENRGIRADDYPHYEPFKKTMSFLGQCNFYVGKDKRIEKHYPILSRDHRQGRSGDLEFKADRYPRGFKIMFYQNVVFENPNGGEYDFDKRKRMPYLLGKQCDLVMMKLSDFLLEKGVLNDTKITEKTAEDFIKSDYIDSFHHPQNSMDFSLSDLDGTTIKSVYNAKDRDGKILLNGDIKYFRNGCNGYLCRGRIYHNINNMWWVIMDKRNVRNVASFQLFDLSESDCLERKAPDRTPKEYLTKRDCISKATTKELIAELRRRSNGRVLE